ncbi:MAG: FkbM family methyltransferase [Woeseiaceae bacterium]|jgi:FkbM family methyltransferase|tara:strand:- start:5411 stop:6133 length:723 start_codon:yes stop_codon:yes gene_type:complete
MKLFKSLKKHSFFWLIKLFLKRLVGRELWLKRELKLETVILGEWEFSLECLNENGIVYSLGVGDSIEFDLEIIKHSNAFVFAFDPTPYAMKWIEQQSTPERLKFYPWAVSGKDGEFIMAQRVNHKGNKSQVMWAELLPNEYSDEVISVPSYTISSIMRKLDHHKIDLMKVDVEGTEYEIINHLLENKIWPKQLLIEFHHRFKSKDKAMTQTAIEELQKVGYKIFSISETGREIGFINLNV